MHSDAQFAGSSSVPAHVEMMGLIGAGNNPMVGMTVAVASDDKGITIDDTEFNMGETVIEGLEANTTIG